MSEPSITVTVVRCLSSLWRPRTDEFPQALQCQQCAIASSPSIELKQWRDLTRFGVNLQFVEPDTRLQDGDEVVLIPPVSGGWGFWIVGAIHALLLGVRRLQSKPDKISRYV